MVLYDAAGEASFFFSLEKNREHMECGVCYTDVPEERRYAKPCCPGILCISCFARLVDPRCPFCRGVFRDAVVAAFSIPSTAPVWTVVASDVAWIDDTDTPSRIRRRRDRRMRQLEERERDRVMNQQLSRVIRESRAESRRAVARDIREDTEIFVMDQNDGLGI
jgi:hypothetical protein